MPHHVAGGEGALVGVQNLEREDEALGDDVAAKLVLGGAGGVAARSAVRVAVLADRGEEAGNVHLDLVLPDAAVHGLAALPLDLDVDDALEGLVDLLDDLGQLEINNT